VALSISYYYYYSLAKMLIKHVIARLQVHLIDLWANLVDFGLKWFANYFAALSLFMAASFVIEGEKFMRTN